MLQVFLTRNPELLRKLEDDLSKLLEPNLRQDAEGRAYQAARSQAPHPRTKTTPAALNELPKASWPAFLQLDHGLVWLDQQAGAPTFFT